jgi:phospholipid/cholesterol/gamma-HCH transport system substrate-binding protein
MSRNVIETVMGAVVLVIAAVFLFFAYSTSQVRSVSGYPLTAKFDKIEGIREGGDVRISGIKVGSILSETLDPTTYLAIVKISINPTLKLPEDTVAEILSSGLLGDKYLALVPGSADKTLQPGGEIKYTQSPVSLEDLIGKYIFNAGSTAKPAGGQGEGAAPKP